MTAAAGAFARRLPAIVTENRQLGSLVWLTVHVPGWPGARPGQFALLQAVDSCCFLGRPLSVAQQEAESVSFLIAPVGEGTREVCALREGELLWVQGPLGNGFDLGALMAGPGRIVIVGGGVGAAPFPLLLSCLAGSSTVPPASAADQSNPELPFRDRGSLEVCEVLVLLGFRDATQAAGAAPIAAAAAGLDVLGVPCPGEVVTEDGSVGRAEMVTEALWRHVVPGDRLAVCGPRAMIVEVARVCAAIPGVTAWFSLEAGMACGVGSCHGCVVPLADGTVARVCREGPVFTSATLFEAGRFSVCERSDGQ